MNKPQTTYAIQFTSPWKIRRPLLYRYMDSEYVNMFFRDGTLRLSSFEAFSKHSDEQRKDGEEGKGILIHTNKEGTGQTIATAMGYGHDAYVMCGSTIRSETLSNDFETTSGFRIHDTTAFAFEISRYIPGFKHGSEGICHYADKRIIHRDMGPVDLETFKVEGKEKTMSLNKLIEFSNSMSGEDLVYLKTSKYSNQSEYRIIWHADSPVSQFIEVKCPNAIQYCTRFEDI